MQDIVVRYAGIRPAVIAEHVAASPGAEKGAPVLVGEAAPFGHGGHR